MNLKDTAMFTRTGALTAFTDAESDLLERTRTATSRCFEWRGATTDDHIAEGGLR